MITRVLLEEKLELGVGEPDPEVEPARELRPTPIPIPTPSGVLYAICSNHVVTTRIQSSYSIEKYNAAWNVCTKNLGLSTKTRLFALVLVLLLTRGYIASSILLLGKSIHINLNI